MQEIVEFISKDSVDAARRTAQSIYARAGLLASFPHMGKAGRVYGTCELPLPPLPFIVVYSVLDDKDAIEIVNLIHGAQQWPRGRPT